MIFSPLNHRLSCHGKKDFLLKRGEKGGAVGKERRRGGKKAALNDNKKKKKKREILCQIP